VHRQSWSKSHSTFCRTFWMIFISVINQLDAQNFCFTISLFHASTCFMCSSSGQNCITQPLVSSHLLVAVSSTALNLCARQPPVGCDDTRGCVMQFWPPDDKQMCSKHVEAWKKLIAKQKFCASSWLITEMHIQQNVKGKKSWMIYYRIVGRVWLIGPFYVCVNEQEQHEVLRFAHENCYLPVEYSATFLKQM